MKICSICLMPDEATNLACPNALHPIPPKVIPKPRANCGCKIADDGAVLLCAWHEAALPYEVWSRESPLEGQRPIRLRSLAQWEVDLVAKQLGTGDDREMILSPDKWPAWPALPIKRYSGSRMPECCVIFAPREDAIGTPIKVYNANLYELADLARSNRWPPPVLKEYPNVGALLADGWVVD